MNTLNSKLYKRFYDDDERANVSTFLFQYIIHMLHGQHQYKKLKLKKIEAEGEPDWRDQEE